MSKSKGRSYAPGRMLTAARQFFAAYCELRRPHITHESGFVLYGISAVVSGCFALELYLKCLRVVDDQPLNGEGHKASAIFGGLSQPAKERIADAWPSQPPLPSDKVRERLAAFDYVFQDWRYVYEKDDLEVDLDDLDDALLAVQRTLHAMRPEWFQPDLARLDRVPSVGKISATPAGFGFYRSRREIP